MLEIVAGLKASGVKAVVLLSGHLGNVTALIAPEVTTSARSNAQLLHADEIETSILLHVNPTQSR